MAPHALRFRRALTLSSSLLHRSLHRAPPTAFSTAPLISQNPTATSSPSIFTPPSRFFTSTTTSLSASRGRNFNPDTDEIGPDTILFEGCDYNHWLIVVDFPKDPAPSPEEMIRFYEETAAKVFGSLEEGKKKIYACSTTTYQGFQVVCSEETSEKFSDIPGVIFVLPDSYIDPVNKEYGGDKYINGEIIPRPPPVQYGRQGPRRDFRSRSSPRGPMEDTRNYGPPSQQNFGQQPLRQQNFGQQPPPRQQNFGQQPPPRQQSFGQQPPPRQQSFGQQPPPPQQSFGQQPPPSQQSFGQQPPPPQQSFGQQPPPHQQNFGQPPPSQQNFGQLRSPQQQNFGMPPPQQNYGLPHLPQQNYGPHGPPAGNPRGGWNNPQGGRGDSMSSYHPNSNQGDWSHSEGENFGHIHNQNNPADQRNPGQTNYVADQGRY